MPRGKYDRTILKKNTGSTLPLAKGTGEETPPMPVTPEIPFVLVSKSTHGKITECIYANDLRGAGCLVRSIWFKENMEVQSATMFHLPGMCVREGKLVRSMN